MNKTLKTTDLYNDLIMNGAFVGDHYKWTHHSQKNYQYGYKNRYSFYNIELNTVLLAKATRFLKQAFNSRKINIVFVGNPKGGAKPSLKVFKEINKPFFPNHGWKAGFISKEGKKTHTILVIYNIAENRDALAEAVKSRVPVVGFLTPKCPVYGVDYPIFLNLDNHKLWFAHYCRALFKKERTCKKTQKVLQNNREIKDYL